MAGQAAAAWFGGPAGAAGFSMYMTMVAGGSSSDAFRAGATSLFTAAVFNAVGGLELSGWQQVGAHALAGGVTNRLSGGSFRDGFISGGVGALGAPLVDGIGNSFGRVVAAGLIGGAAARAGGGSFEDGFTTAAFGRLFNHELHKQKVATFTLGAGGSIMTGQVGASADSGIAFDTTGNICLYSNLCVRLGVGESGGLGITGGLSVDQSPLSTGSSTSVGSFIDGGAGIYGDFSASVNSGADSVGVGKGLVGVGGGQAIGTQACTSTTICWK